MKRYSSVFNLTLLISAVLLANCSLNTPPASALTKRHMVIYGGLKEADLAQVAEYADILVLDYIRRPLLQRLKALNPDLVLLKYQHGIGYHPSYPAWSEVDRNEDWFVHDAGTGERLVERKYGWYLMDMTAASWKQFWAAAIVQTTDSLYDGVFIDDCWNRFVPKFLGQRSRSPGRPSNAIIRDWTRHVNELLGYLKTRYNGLVYVNGAHPEYLSTADGCMEEGFIHAGWEPGNRMPDAYMVARTLLRIRSLQAFGKPILLQSGTLGDDPATHRSIYRFCWAAYLLVADDNTSFNFHPHPGYGYKGLFKDVEPIDPGRPKGAMQLTETVDLDPNLAPNPGFERGLSPWKVLSGNPESTGGPGSGRTAIRLESRSGESDRIISPLIPVRANTDYQLSVRCQAEFNRAVSAGYRKLGLQGRFFDSSRNQLPGAHDLQFDEGRFDWLTFGRRLTSPDQAAYFQIRIGFIGDGIGKGQIDKVRLAPARSAPFVIQRPFSAATVFLNAGSRPTILSPDKPLSARQPITLDPGQAKIIQRQAP